jgi:hypothetical protein
MIKIDKKIPYRDTYFTLGNGARMERFMQRSRPLYQKPALVNWLPEILWMQPRTLLRLRLRDGHMT